MQNDISVPATSEREPILLLIHNTEKKPKFSKERNVFEK
jgi:hypothetical protein